MLIKIFITILFAKIIQCQINLSRFSPLVENLVKNYGKQTVEQSKYHQIYDFVIVGSGPGGCVLANRLTENPKIKVLMIEAGTVETIAQGVPLIAPLSVESRYNWGYLAEKQEYSCRGLRDGQCAYPRGKALGGSSVINGMVYTRGSKGDFDHWKQLGIENWDYETQVLPAFKRSERANLKYFHKPEFHNISGSLSVTNSPYETPFAEIFINAMKSLNYSEIDLNSDDSIGVGRLQSNTLRGVRHSAFEAFIRPVLKRKNLHIMINTRVTKILIDRNKKEAFGVEILRNGQKMKILAKFENILAAGTFHSPQILILSGIGASEDLKRLKISQVVDLQVGKFLYDHPSFPGIIILTNLTSPFSNFFNPQTFLPVALDFINGKGLMTIANGIEALAFIKSQNSTTLVDSQPDIEIFSVGAGPQSDFGLAVKYGERLKDEIYDDWIKPLEYHPNHTSLMPVSLLHTKSVGFLEITSKNIFDNPKLTSNFLKEPEDMKMFIEGIRFVEKLIETPPYKAVDAKLYKKPITGCEMHEFGSESYWECAVRTFTVSLHHQLGTCKMGSENDKNSVVNSRLKVIGMKKLRIVDTSVVPAAASAHTNALSCMIGERATEFIREEYGV